VPGKKSRLATKVATAVIGAAGACVLLAACSTVKIGSAAIIGDQRISTAQLDAHVTSVQQTITQDGLTKQASAATLPKDVLTWLIRFAVTDRAAQDAGITVTPAQTQDTLKKFDAAERQSVQSQGQAYPGLDALLALNGISPDQRTAFGRWLTQENALEAKANGGTPPASQAEQTRAFSQMNVTACKTVKSLNVQVNPQFGQLNYQVNPTTGQGFYAVGAVADTLSRPAGKASSAPTAPAKEPC
jgi:hypothetical protein